MNHKPYQNSSEVEAIPTLQKEIHAILEMISPAFNTQPVTQALDLTVSLYKGHFPGYQACNTDYHDLSHTTATFLAMARLIHGAMLDEISFSEREVTIGLIASLLHDAGYIQEESDHQGTGAKHTATHVRRSINFMQKHGKQFNLTQNEISAGCDIILCTDLGTEIHSIGFTSESIKLLGKILGTADLIAQMADRIYLEKLLYLYHEFKESNIGDYENEIDLLQKTVGFYDAIEKRIKTTLDGADSYMDLHFSSQYDNIGNPYNQAIKKHKQYLLQILELPDKNPSDLLKRSGIVDKIRRNNKK